MRVDASPDVRHRLGDAAMGELRAGPDEFQLSISRGRSGYGATLIRRYRSGYELLGDTNGHPEPEDAINAVIDVIRPRPTLVRSDDDHV